jgi:glutamate-1-semialdehyde 2,1-aminomutase
MSTCQQLARSRSGPIHSDPFPIRSIPVHTVGRTDRCKGGAVSEFARVIVIDTAFTQRTTRSGLHASRARRVIPAGISHNVRRAVPYPLAIARAEGPRKWDLDGNDYVDFGMANSSLLLGHNEPAVVEAIVRQAAITTGTCSCHELEVEWAELICQMVPCAERVRFCGTGSEATSLALRVARAATGRRPVVRLAHHYHGWHDHVLAGHSGFFDHPEMRGVAIGDGDVVVVDGDWTDDHLDAAIRAAAPAAVIVEPSGPRWGAAPLRDGLLAAVRRSATACGAVLVFDEVITGFRYAPGGAQQRSGVTPDLAALGKIVSGGLPGGALVGSAALLDELSTDRADPVFHRGTFNANPLSAAAGVATLRIAAKPGTHQALDDTTDRFRVELQRRLDALGAAALVHGEASVFHVHLAAPGQSLPSVGATAAHYLDMSSALVDEFLGGVRERGVDLFSFKGGVLSTAHDDASLERGLDALEATVAALCAAGAVGRHG